MADLKAGVIALVEVAEFAGQPQAATFIKKQLEPTAHAALPIS